MEGDVTVKEGREWKQRYAVLHHTELIVFKSEFNRLEWLIFIRKTRQAAHEQREVSVQPDRL